MMSFKIVKSKFLFQIGIIVILLIPCCNSLFAQTWTKILNGKIISNLGFPVDNDNTILVGRVAHFGDIDSTEFLRINQDGTVVEQYLSGLKVFKITVNPKNPDEIYIAGSEDTGNLPQLLFHSINGGISWAQIGTTLVHPGDSWFSNIWLHPVYPDTIFAGVEGWTTRRILRSFNQGTSWDTLNPVGNEYFDRSFSGIEISKVYPKRIYLIAITIYKTQILAIDNFGTEISDVVDTSEYPLPVFPENNAPRFDAIYPWRSDSTESFLIHATDEHSEGRSNYLLSLTIEDSTQHWTLIHTFNIDSLVFGRPVVYRDEIYMPILSERHTHWGEVGIIGSTDSGNSWHYIDTTGIGGISFDSEARLVLDTRIEPPNIYLLTNKGLYKATLPLQLGNDWTGLKDDSKSLNGNDIKSRLKLYAVYPNPMNGVLTVQYKLEISKPVKLEIYDILGRQVQTKIIQPTSKNYTTTEFDLSTKASGIYILKVSSGNMSVSEKFTLIK